MTTISGTGYERRPATTPLELIQGGRGTPFGEVLHPRRPSRSGWRRPTTVLAVR